MPEQAPPSLSVVIPVYNDRDWLARVVRDVREAIDVSPFTDSEIIVVDDGSDLETQRVLSSLAAQDDVRVIRQENAGRFAARRTGLMGATGELALLIDARVSIAPHALAFVADRLPPDGPFPVWNAHVVIDVEGNPYARFWNVLTELTFRDYFANPRTTSFGLEEFDRFPKGTTCFLAPRQTLLSAISAFETRFADVRDANDDTILIRSIAARHRVNISPEFSCLYRSRDALAPFLRHAYHRGGVLVDGYGRPGTRFFGLIVAFLPASATGVLALVARPRQTAVAAILAVAAVGAATRVAARRSWREAAAVMLLGPAWLAAYGAGIWRGVALAITAHQSKR